jgi:centrin-3
MDKDGYLDFHELKVALRALGFDLPKSEISAILRQYGVPADNLLTSTANASSRSHAKQAAIPAFSGATKLIISHAEFSKVAATHIAARDPADEINKAFDLFDTNAKGGLDIDDLRRVARELNEGLTEEEMQAMIEEFDLDGDGLVSREEFLNICLG